MQTTEASITSVPCIGICNSLLRGELSAMETYDQAIHKYTDTPVVDELYRIRFEHTESAARLAECVRDMGGRPESRSGVWGVFAHAVQSAAGLFGKGSAFHSLQRGEMMGCKDYESALRDDSLLPACRELISDVLLPRTRLHVAALNLLAKSV